jgi:predicted transcriptional regulator
MIPLNTVRPWKYPIGNGRHYRRRRVPCWSWPTIETDEDVQKAVAQIKANVARRTPQINAQDALEDLIKAELEKSDEDFDLAELVTTGAHLAVEIC